MGSDTIDGGSGGDNVDGGDGADGAIEPVVGAEMALVLTL